MLGGLKDGQAVKGYEVLHFQPFDPIHKRTEAEVRGPDGRQFKVAKGAPQVILDLSANEDQVRPEVTRAIGAFAARGFRSLGVARTDDHGDWQFQGILPLYDPPREDSKATIETAEKMGVRVKMITGDQTVIAREIARQLEMGTNILDASLFDKTKHHEAAELDDAIERVDGFAQVYPEHKYHIVDVLQKRGHIVGMTGDGVNDAPALKKSDAGIAVSGATDAARAAADIVLLTPGLSVVIDAIMESRKIFQRMTSYAIYRIAETIRVLLFMTLSILVFNFYPVTAVMIVLLALLNDGAILSIAYDRVRYSDQPEVWRMREILGVASVLGLAGVLSSFGLFYLGERSVPPRPGDDPVSDVPQALGGGPHDHLRDPHTGSLLVHPAGTDPVRGGGGDSSAGDVDRRLRAVHGTDRLGSGAAGLELRSGLVPGQRPLEADRLPDL